MDTVKQAEVFAAVRARFGVERDDNLALREFPTLAHVIGVEAPKVEGRCIDLGDFGVGACPAETASVAGR